MEVSISKAPTHSQVIISLCWYGGVSSKGGWGSPIGKPVQGLFRGNLQEARLQLLGRSGDPDSRWQRPEENLGMRAERKGQILKTVWKTRGCVSARAEPQLALGCRSGGQRGLCCLWEGCGRTERGGGEEEVQGASGGQAGCQPVSGRTCQMSMQN